MARLAATVLAVAIPWLAGAPATAMAQAPSTWVTAWGGLYLDPGTVRDGDSGTVWDFGTSAGAGIGVQRQLGRSLLAGLDLGYAPVRHEVRDAGTGVVLADGRAHLLTTMVTGRLGAGGDGFFSYLSGGAGAVTYGIPHLDRWDPDFAFRVGPGLEYRQARHLALYVQWNRWWVLHQSEGVSDNTVRHSNLELGLRWGF